jgi:hypothetical protein
MGVNLISGTGGRDPMTYEEQIAQVQPMNGVSATSKILGVGPSTIYREINKGEIPIIEIGNRKNIPGWYILDQISRPDTDAAA